MKDLSLDFTKFNRKHVIMLIVLLVSMPFILGLILNIPLGRYTIGSEDSWISFNGSYLGGIVGGVTGGFVAFYIAKLQIDAMRREQDRVFNDNYKKTYLKIENYFVKTEPLLINSSSMLFSKMSHHMEAESNAKNVQNSYESKVLLDVAESTLDDIKKIEYDLKQFQLTLENIASEYIPIDIYKDFINLIWILDKMIVDIQEFLKNDYIYPLPPNHSQDDFHQNVNNRLIQHRIVERNPDLVDEYMKYQKTINDYYLNDAKMSTSD